MLWTEKDPAEVSPNLSTKSDCRSHGTSKNIPFDAEIH